MPDRIEIGVHCAVCGSTLEAVLGRRPMGGNAATILVTSCAACREADELRRQVAEREATKEGPDGSG